MGTTQTGFFTVSCDGPKCDKNVTFEGTPAGEQTAFQENPWLQNLRYVTPAMLVVNGQRIERKLLYCSDTCEAEGIASGTHNKQEPNRIIPANAQQAELAARAAASAAALKQPIIQP